MDARTPDYGHAAGELAATPWLAHLAGGAAAVTGLLAWTLAVFVGPEYLAPYREQAVALTPAAQLALMVTSTLGGIVGWIALLAGAVFVLFVWSRARRSGGLATAMLFVLAGAFAISGTATVMAVGAAGHAAQDASATPR